MLVEGEKAIVQQKVASLASMRVDLIHASTPDGLRLDGSLQMPEDGVRHPGLDAIICVHGAYGNFYGAVFNGLFPRLLKLGVAVLRPNLRSHDIISRSPSLEGERVVGSAYEIVDECRHDLQGWVHALAARGLHRIGFLGHCLGAIKALYVQAWSPIPEIKCVAGISPPRFSYSWYRRSDRAEPFNQQYAEMQSFVAAGVPRQLVWATAPYNLLQSAESYLDMYGPEERYNVLSFTERVTCPQLHVFGEIELEEMYSMKGLDQELAALPDRTGGRRKIKVVNGANHLYKGKAVRADLETELEQWFINEHTWKT